MSAPAEPLKRHRHEKERRHVIAQRAGVPYELEQTICTACGRILSERHVGRAAA